MGDSNQIDAAMQYASYGWHVMPLRGKIPTLAAWQRAASIDEEQIIRWWDEAPGCNLGVQLGRRSNLIDIEADSAQAEKEIVELFGGEAPLCPTYQAKRGKHRLFLWRDDMPAQAVIHVGEVEVRLGGGGKGAQSVFPPSIHDSGMRYEWLPGLSPSEIDAPRLPDVVNAKLWNLAGESMEAPTGEARSAEHWEKILSGLPEGERNTGLTSIIGHQLRGAADLHDQTKIRVMFMLVETMNERNNPPLSEKELLATFTGLLKREQNRRLTEDVAEGMPPPVEQQVKPPVKSDTWGFRVRIIESNPPQYEVYHEYFADAEGGCITLTAEEYISGTQFRTQALKQSQYPLPASFGKLWSSPSKGEDGKPGLSIYQRLTLAAERVAAPMEQIRPLVVAERLYAALSRAIEPTEGEGDLVHPAGRPTKMKDGAIVFRFGAVWEDMKFGPDQITRIELSKCLEKIGSNWHFSRIGGKSVRHKRIDAAGQLALENMVLQRDLEGGDT